MTVTDVKLTKTAGRDSCLAYGSMTLDNEFIVNGIRVVKSKQGYPFVAFPSRKNAEGEYKDICFAVDKTLREDIAANVLAAYEELK